MTYVLEALGWGVLHGAWIAPVLVGAGALMLAALRGAHPGVRHGIALAVLAAVAAVPWIVGGYVYFEYAEHLDWVARNAAGHSAAELHALHSGMYSPVLSGPSASALAALAVGAALLWLSVSCRGLVVLAGESFALKRVVRALTDCGDEGRRGLLESLRHTLAVRRPVRLAVSPGLPVPMVSGVRRPVVLLPAGPAAPQDEAAIAHELAHVRRGDVLTNLLQRLVEVTTSFNPARAWLSRRIERERELATDLLACRALPGPRSEYVRALMALEERRPQEDGLRLSLHGNGDLVGRVRALAYPARRRPPALRVALLAAGLMCACRLLGDHVVRPAVRGSVELVMERDLSTRIDEASRLTPGRDSRARTTTPPPPPAQPPPAATMNVPPADGAGATAVTAVTTRDAPRPSAAREAEPTRRRRRTGFGGGPPDHFQLRAPSMAQWLQRPPSARDHGSTRSAGGPERLAFTHLPLRAVRLDSARDPPAPGHPPPKGSVCVYLTWHERQGTEGHGPDQVAPGRGRAPQQSGDCPGPRQHHAGLHEHERENRGRQPPQHVHQLRRHPSLPWSRASSIQDSISSRSWSLSLPDDASSSASTA